jgi:hypothetical protein
MPAEREGRRNPGSKKRGCWARVWAMKLRFDLVKKLTPEMLMESILANNHRYKAEPLLSKTGVGSLSSASTADHAIEEKLSMDITRKLMSGSESGGRTPSERVDAG